VSIELLLLLEAVLVGVIAVVATNLDNLLLSLNMAQVDGIRRTATVFISVQALAILLALGLSQGLEGFPAHWIGYLGILPVSLGVYELIRRIEHEAVPASIGVFPSALLLASNSGDSLAVLMVTFSDLSENYDLVALIGAGMAAIALTTLLIVLSTRSVTEQYLGLVARRLQPWLMILIGLFILWDSPIDVL
jgi:cadmium resistance protein CadD (predicted permease)